MRTALSEDRGAVTVEAALALCTLVLVLALAIGTVAVTSARLRCLDAARETARLVARGEPDRAREVGEAVAPTGARVEVRVHGDEVTVDVVSNAAGLPGLTVTGRAIGVLEPGALLDAAGLPQSPGHAPAGTPAADVGVAPAPAGGPP
ncbi:hypothetical protein GCM10023321_04560 [Pseudonocardia eucalypti]|uniref:Pilus assembly protein TadE n=1 Tax=Pseudonocardia eucalypti TaxID=648755 RepID=A0ABP9PFX1_9PSEU|nr:hypothetical protein [Pseudonocardia eucalypti]